MAIACVRYLSNQKRVQHLNRILSDSQKETNQSEKAIGSAGFV